VQASVPGARDRTPSTAAAKDEDHVVDAVLRLEADDERRIAVLLKDHRGHERRLETVSGAVTDHLAVRPQRLALQLPVVREAAKELLDLFRGAMPLDDSPLFACEGVRRQSQASHKSAAPMAAGSAWMSKMRRLTVAAP